VDWFSLAFRWFFALWLMGWLVLPLWRRVLGGLPDGGLAVGRVLTPTFASLPLFWLASFQKVPLKTAPLFLILPVIGSLFMLRTPQARSEFFAWVRAQRAALLWSDAVFLGGFALFLWIRMRNPQVAAYEKPMDSALLHLLLRSEFLPPDSFWFSGTPFTNYYYYGQFISANIARALGTNPPYVYNLVHPLWCAFFLSALWPLCAALCSGVKHNTRPAFARGLAATIIIGLLGHYEPVRQIFDATKGPLGLGSLWPLDWWTTSRVIPDTINEYPAFTLTLADLHAHFFALSFTACLATLCYALFKAVSTVPETEEIVETVEPPLTAKQAKQRAKAKRKVVEVQQPAPTTPPASIDNFTWFALLLALGTLMGIMYMTNTWDLPVSALFVMACAAITRPGRNWSYWPWVVIPPVLAYVVAWPYRRLFAMPLSGIQFDLFKPPLLDFLMFWGLMLVLAGIGATVWYRRRAEPEAHFGLLLTGAGLMAVFVPYFCFIQSKLFTGGSMDHLNMVFKIGLQAWVLLGLAGVCGTLASWASWPRPAKWTFPLVFVVPALCSACVIWTWAWRDAPRDIDGKVHLSLNGTNFLSEPDQAALLWLYHNAGPRDAVVEAVGNESYDRWGRVSCLSGVPTPLGWKQHSKQFGAEDLEIQRRFELVLRVYNWQSDADALAALEDLKPLGVRWVFVGDLERATYPPSALQQMQGALKTAFQDGDTRIFAVP
jgi:uncharacterized membrane protein